MKQPKMLLLGGGLALGVLALATRSGKVTEIANEVEEAVSEATDWMKKVFDRVSEHEGWYDSLNLNTDDAGLSVGRLQWAQRPGALGTLLAGMYAVDPTRFAATFGPSWSELLRVTQAATNEARLGPVGGVVLWKEPWVSRFRTAGRDPTFQAVQDKMALEGPYFEAALQVARMIGFVTERTVALGMDTAVQQGPGGAREVARKVRLKYAGQQVAMATVLEAFARQAAAPFLRTTPPPVESQARWKEVAPGIWHKYAGSIDLYENILRRRMGIVEDDDLADDLLEAMEGGQLVA